MKKILIYALCLSMALCFSGCKKQEKQAVAEAQSEDELVVYDLMEKFYQNPENVNCVVSDHAVATDKASDLIGAVCYTDALNNPSCLAFISNDGFKSVKLDDNGKMQPASGSKLIYLGDGKVSFMLQEKDSDKVYEYTLFYQVKDSEAEIKTESKLLED